MEPAPEWSEAVAQSLAAVAQAVRAAGRNAEAQPLWQFLRRGGRIPAGRLPPGALAGPQVYEAVRWDSKKRVRVRRAPDFAGAPPLQSASAVGHHVAAVTTLGEVLCSERPRKGLATVSLPWPAAAVSCGLGGVYRHEKNDCLAVALRRGGRGVCTWRLGTRRRGRGAPAAPEEVRGLPPDDPVVAIDTGEGVAAALTASGAAYGWGHEDIFRHLGAADGAAVRIPQLSGRRVRRLGCGYRNVLAETEGGQVLCLDLRVARDAVLSLLPADAALAFPLRDWHIFDRNVALLDAVGTIWSVDIDGESRALGKPRCAGSQPWRMVRLTREWILTDCGELWQCNANGCANFTAAHRLPRGLVPYNSFGDYALLLPDLSCGRRRLELFARIAVRVGLPSDMVRVELLRHAVQSFYVLGPVNDPFSRCSAEAPSPAGAAGAAAAAAGS